MADEEDYESDTSNSTVLLEDFINKPKKVDAKRLRMSKLNDSLLSGKCEDQGTAPEVAGANKEIGGSSNTNKQKNFNNDEVICIDSDEETQEKENISVTTDLHRDINYTKVNIFEHAKLRVLEPGKINARRATSNIFEQSEEHMNSLLGVGENKKERKNIVKASIINARRATTGFEEKSLIDKKINVFETCNNIFGSGDTNSIANTSMKQKTEVKDKNDASNTSANKRFRNEDETPGVTKRIRMNTDSKLDGKCEEIIKNADKGQETNENHSGHNIFLMPLKPKTSEVLNKQVLSQSQNKKHRKEEYGQEKGNLQDMQEIGEAGDNKETNKCNDKHKACEIPDGLGRNELHSKEVRVEAQGNSGINQTLMSEVKVRNEQEIREVLEAKIPSEGKKKEESKNVQEEQIGSKQAIDKYPDTNLKKEKCDSHNANQKQGARIVPEKKGDNEKIIDAKREKPEKKETKQKITTANKGRILKFQVNFFTFVKDFIIKSLYPQSAIFLQNLIQRLITDAKAGKFWTDITFNCPQCNHKSTYSANLLHDTEDNETIPRIDESQKCALCNAVANLHTTYLNRYLQETAAKNEMSKSVENPLTAVTPISQQDCKQKSSEPNLQSSDHVVDKTNAVNISSVDKISKEADSPTPVSKEVFKQNMSTTNEIHKHDAASAIDDLTKKRKTTEQLNDAKCRKLGIEQVNVHNNNPTPTCASLPKDDIAVSNLDSNLKTNTDGKDIVLSINNQTNTSKTGAVPDGHTKKLVILSIQDVTPGRKSVYENKEYSGSVEKNNINTIDKIQGDTDLSTTQNVAKESDAVCAIEVRINERSCSSINPDFGLQSKLNYDKVPENTDKDTISKNASNRSDNRDIGSGNHRKDMSNLVEENVGNNKTSISADSKLPDANSERRVVEEKLDADTQRPNSENNNTVNVTEKTLENLYENLKNNANAEDKEDEEVESKYKNNITRTPVPVKIKKNQTPSLDTQPCSAKKRKRDQYTCPTCTCTYSFPSKLLSHMSEKHNITLSKIPDKCIKRQCEFCSNMFFKKQFNNHVKKHHNDMFTKIVNANGTAGNSSPKKPKSEVKNQSHTIDNKGNQTSKAPKYQYHCSICDAMLSTVAATTQHRKHKHPNFGRQQIFNKVVVEDSDSNANDASNDDKSDESSVEANTHDQNSKLEGNARDNTSSELTTNRDEPNSLKGTPNAKDDANETGSDKHDHVGDSGDNSNAVSVLESGSHQNESSDKTAYDNNRSSNNKQSSTNGNHKTNINQVNESMQANKKCEASNSITDVKVGDFKEQEGTCNKSSKYISQCRLCKEIFTSVHATRKHREEKHPHFRGIALFQNIASNSNSLVEHDFISKQSKPLAEDRTSDTDVRKHFNKRIEENTDNSNSHIDNNIHIEKDFSNSGDEVLKPSASAVKNKKERITKLFGEDNSPTLQNEVNINSSNRIEKYFGSGDEVLNPSASAVKNKEEQNKMLEKNDDETQNEVNLKSNVNEAKNSIVQITENNESNIVSKPNIVAEGNPAKNKSVKESKHVNVTEDKDKTVSTFFEHETTVIDKINDDYDHRLKNKQNVGESHTVSTRTENTKREGTNNNGMENVIREAEAMEVDPQLLENNAQDKQIRCDHQGTTSNITNTGDKTDDNVENKSNEACSNKTDLHKSKTDQYRKENDGRSDKTIDSNELMNENDVLNNFHDDDRAEIDQINRLLESYAEGQTEMSNVENHQAEKPDVANVVQVNNSLNLSVEAKTCLENIKITNVTSIADKIYIYVCQECQYATDNYDSAIRHCQNHYNEVEDAVNYCQVCEVNYDVSCYDKHEISHDNYLKSKKIKFSHTWLFSNWQAVFNDMPLIDVEDIQMKSIYKTFCVRMTVKQEGSWLTALYQCGECNTCVPPQELERHVKGKCNFINYLCRACNNTFLTYEMRIHHEVYHKQDESKPFKIIIFNEQKDKDFNLKLLQAKAEQRRKEKQKNSKKQIDIVKCLCGLAFASWNKFKIHFVECTDEVSKGIKCPKCVKLEFLEEDLADHLSHHDAYEFKVRRITFKEENVTNENSEQDTLSGLLNDDLEIKNEMMKDEVLTQCTQNSEFDFDDEDLRVKRELIKNEVSSQDVTGDLDESGNLCVEDFGSDVEFIE